MCGLFVVLQQGQPIDRARAQAALHSLLHRGPDGHALEFSSIAPPPGQDGPTTHIALGHARLAILDPDPRSNQPFSRADSTLVCNGEIYNFRDLAPRLRQAGITLDTTGDTEVLLHLLLQDGVDGLGAANGMWALCWLDRGRRRLIAARDRYGKKPLFYRVGPGGICIASEIKALLAYSAQAALPAPGTIESFMAEGWLFPREDGATHLDGIREVRPGHALTLDLDSWAMHERRVVGVRCDAGDAALDDDTLAGLLVDAVELRLVSDRRVGLLLSGGVDSSLILSILAARGHAERVTCITGEAGKSEDAAYAARALAQLGLKSLVVPLDYGAASFAPFLDVCRHQEKPFPLIGNVLGLPALYRAIAADGICVALDGTGADEVFGGYWDRHAPFAMRDAARAGDAAWLERLRAGGQLPARAHDQDAPWQHRLMEQERSYLSPEASRAVLATPSRDPLVGFPGTLGEALARDATGGRMQEWLWQNDRNAMAEGVENRSPLLDHRLARWMSSGHAAKLDGPWNKRELRRMFSRFVTLSTATRPTKQGMRWVYGRFLRHNRDRVLGLVAGSGIARAMLDRDRLLADAARDDAVLELDLVQRLLVVAGLEAVGLLAAR